MLQSIFDILSSIGDFFSMVFDFAFSLITDVVDVVKVVISLPGLLVSSFSWFPLSISGLLAAIIAFLVIMRIVKYYGD